MRINRITKEKKVSNQTFFSPQMLFFHVTQSSVRRNENLACFRYFVISIMSKYNSLP